MARKTVRKTARKSVGKTVRKTVRKTAPTVRKVASRTARKTTPKTASKTARNATRKTRQTSGAFAALKVSDSFRAFVLAQLDEFGDVTARAMFGGVGLYRRGVFFGIVAGDVLYFKVGDANRRDFEQRQAPPFRPYPDRPSMKYFAVPVDVLENAGELTAWARKAVHAAGAHA